MPVLRRLPPDLTWFKSSHSGGNTTECLEAAFASPGVFVRDSKQPGYTSLTFSVKAWDSFIAEVRHIEAN